jgi:hypothetical protein
MVIRRDPSELLDAPVHRRLRELRCGPAVA